MNIFNIKIEKNVKKVWRWTRRYAKIW